MAAPVRATALAKAFNGVPVLHGVDLTIPAGGFVSIVGRSGCGKSTLLRLLVGLDAPTSGAVDAGGAAARLVFQEPRLLPWASVEANVAVGLGREPANQDDRDAVSQALAFVGLGDRGRAWPAQLSGGQKQRVALARALVSQPGFLALDEPFGALDALTRIEMQRLLEDVWRQKAFTAVLVTHDVSEAVALGDRVILIDAGRVALDIAVPAERPRKHGDPRLSAIEAQVLERLFQA